MIVIWTHFLVSLPDRAIVETVGSATKSSSPMYVYINRMRDEQISSRVKI